MGFKFNPLTGQLDIAAAPATSVTVSGNITSTAGVVQALDASNNSTAIAATNQPSLLMQVAGSNVVSLGYSSSGFTYYANDNASGPTIYLWNDGHVGIGAGASSTVPFQINAAATVVTIHGANLTLDSVGTGITIKEGSGGRMGTATLVGGTAVVSNSTVTANTRIFLTSDAPGGTPGWLSISTRTASTSFTILSSNALDTSTVSWLLVEPS